MQVGMFEAKTQLSKLVAAVRDGEEVTLTQHGKPVARIVPMEERTYGADFSQHPAFGMLSNDTRSVEEIMQEIRKPRHDAI